MKRPHSFNNRLITLGVFVGLVLAATGVRAQPCSTPGVDEEDASPIARAPSFLNAWIAKYPTSTLPARMDTLTGRDCNVCHHPPNLNTPGNCYRADIKELIGLGMSIEQALDQLDAVDSDSDGVSNGQEAIAPRPESGEIGYNPGLIGDLGTDPCGTIPNASVTGMPETPFSASIPAVSDWGIVALVLLLVTCGSVVLRTRTCGG